MRRLDFGWLAAFVTIGALTGACGGGESTPPAEPAAQEEVAPAAAPAEAPAAREQSRLVAPIRGEAQLGYTTPDTNIEGDEVVTMIRVKNMSANGAIAGLKVDEFWWDADDNAVGGATARVRQPLGPGEVADIELRTARDSSMSRNSYNFSHANGEIKAVPLESIEDGGDETEEEPPSQ